MRRVGAFATGFDVENARVLPTSARWRAWPPTRDGARDGRKPTRTTETLAFALRSLQGLGTIPKDQLAVLHVRRATAQQRPCRPPPWRQGWRVTIEVRFRGTSPVCELTHPKTRRRRRRERHRPLSMGFPRFSLFVRFRLFIFFHRLENVYTSYTASIRIVCFSVEYHTTL